MKHKVNLKKLNRSPAHRRALLRNMATNLIDQEKFETTISKAKALRRVVEKLITLGTEDTLHRRRKALSYVFKEDAVTKLFTELGPRFKSRPGGYTRITRSGRRHGDAAELAIIEFV